MAWKNALKEGQELVLATCSKNKIPRAIVVISLGLIDNRILIGACQLKTSLRNIKENKKVSVAVKYKKEYYRINGDAKLHSSGKYFDIAFQKSKPFMPKYAITIDIKEVFDLDKIKRII